MSEEWFLMIWVEKIKKLTNGMFFILFDSFYQKLYIIFHNSATKTLNIIYNSKGKIIFKKGGNIQE